jgi:hypothetical protein
MRQRLTQRGERRHGAGAFYEFQRERSQLGDWANRKGPDAIQDYQVEKNARSIDGLPAVTWIAGGGNSGRTS